VVPITCRTARTASARATQDVGALAGGAGDNPYRRNRRSEAEDVFGTGGHDYRSAMHGRQSDRMGINDVPGICPGAMKDGPGTASEVKVRRNYAHYGTRGAGLAMPRKGSLDGSPRRGTGTS
jgi:hypothetical protein